MKKISHDIRKFDFDKDFSSFAKLEIKRFDQPMEKNQTIYLLKKYTNKYWFILDISDNGELDAYLISGIEKSGALHIFSIAVREKFEAQGWAKCLLDYLIKNAKSDKIKIIELEVREDNERAIKLYQSFGFKIKHVKYDYYDNSKNALSMELEIF